MDLRTVFVNVCIVHACINNSNGWMSQKYACIAFILVLKVKTVECEGTINDYNWVYLFDGYEWIVWLFFCFENRLNCCVS